MNTLYPVILAVPRRFRDVKGREKVAFLSRYAREALRISAGMQKIVLPEMLEKDKNGAPVPLDGIFWSISHKSEHVGGVVAPSKTGIDIEKIRTVSKRLFQKTARDHEWDLGCHEPPLNLFFRFWTAKEAVLKAAGTGIADLLKCEVIQIIDPANLLLRYRKRSWRVEHVYFEDHIAAVVKNDLPVQWTIRPGVRSRRDAWTCPATCG